MVQASFLIYEEGSPSRCLYPSSKDVPRQKLLGNDLDGKLTLWGASTRGAWAARPLNIGRWKPTAENRDWTNAAIEMHQVADRNCPEMFVVLLVLTMCLCGSQIGILWSFEMCPRPFLDHWCCAQCAFLDKQDNDWLAHFFLHSLKCRTSWFSSQSSRVFKHLKVDKNQLISSCGTLFLYIVSYWHLCLRHDELRRQKSGEASEDQALLGSRYEIRLHMDPEAGALFKNHRPTSFCKNTWGTTWRPKHPKQNIQNHVRAKCQWKLTGCQSSLPRASRTVWLTAKETLKTRCEGERLQCVATWQFLSPKKLGNPYGFYMLTSWPVEM